MNQADRKNEYRPRRNERLTPEGVATTTDEIWTAESSLRRLHPVLMRLMESQPILQPDTARVETYQTTDGRQLRFAPIVGAGAVQSQPDTYQYSQNLTEQADFIAWEQQMHVMDPINLAEAANEPYREPGYLSAQTSDAVAAAQRLVDEAYRSSQPYSDVNLRDNEHAA